MIYSEASYAGPDAWGRTFEAHSFQHIADRQKAMRLERIRDRQKKIIERNAR
jgi:hypothetical protein